MCFIVNPDLLKPVSPKAPNTLTDSQAIIDIGKKTTETVQKIGIIGAIILTIVVILIIVLILKKKKRKE